MTAEPARVTAWGAAGLVLHMLIGLFPYGVTALLTSDVIALVAFFAVWLILAVVAWRLRRRRSPLPLAVPVGALALWFGLVTLGDVFLGWSA